MNASEREAITFSIEVEPLVETFPESGSAEADAGAAAGALPA